MKADGVKGNTILMNVKLVSGDAEDRADKVGIHDH